ncbi:MAG: hypothetical protein MK008_09350 [Bdellovibrionales bacterium]|nr:hypothetical protein [Bdellovibrionales bacterium]
MSKTDFEKHFLSIYKTRWESLYQALLADEKQKVMISEHEFKPKIQSFGHTYEYDQSAVEDDKAYALDLASVVVADQFKNTEEGLFLDMCSAPGGKALYSLLNYNYSEYIFNDLSKQRLKRLTRVLKNYSSKDNYRVYNHDASRWGQFYPNTYDSILLDAPCSGERHLLENPSELEKWSAKRSKRLQKRQLALICSAYDALKPNGELVYSTCSISPLENEELIYAFQKKRKGFKIDFNTYDFCEPVDVGAYILPDKTQGLGPIFYTRILKGSD